MASLWLMVGSCSCEERLRKAVTGSGEQSSVDRTFDDTGESSQPREEEPNDVAEQATLFQLGSERRPIQGALAEGDDVDWYAVRAVAGQSWLVTLRVVPDGDVDVDVGLEISRDDSGRLTYDTAGAGEAERVRHLAVTDDVVRFAVRSGNGGAGDYELVFKKQLSGGAIEREPNDTLQTATEFEFPGEIQGFYDRPNDRDWFHSRRDETSPGIYRLSVTPTGEFSHRLKMHTRREADSPYLSMQVPPDEPSSIPNLRIPGEIDGLWLSMQADDNYSQSSGYRVRAVPHPTNEGYRIEGEPNDDDEQAIGIEVGEVVRGYLHTPSDLDRFRLAVGRSLPSDIDEAEGERAEERRDVSDGPERDTGTDTEAPRDTGKDAGEPGAEDEPAYIPPLERVLEKEQAGHIVQVGLRPIAETDRLALIHSGDAGKSTVEADGRGESVKLCNLAVDEELISIGIRGKHVEPRQVRDDFTYELTTVDILDEVDGLEIEPNDERDEADRLEFGAIRTGFIAKSGDRDVYAFGIPDPRKMKEASSDSRSDAGGGSVGRAENEPESDAGPGPEREEEPPAEPVSVEITLTSNRLNLGFEVLDEQGAKIAEIDRSGAGVNESTSLDLPPGLYFVAVSSARDFECRPYEISVSRD